MDEPILKRCRDIRHSPDGKSLIWRIWPGIPPEQTTKLLTPRDVSAWLGKGLPRAPECIERLTESLNSMASTVHVSEALSFDPSEEAYAAWKVLQRRLPLLILTAEQNRKGPLAAALVQLSNAVQAIDAIFVPTQAPDHKAVHWHDDAIWLLYVMRQTDPNVKISSSGPGVRFLLRALDFVWGEQLRRKRKKLNGDQIRRAVERYDRGITAELVWPTGMTHLVRTNPTGELS